MSARVDAVEPEADEPAGPDAKSAFWKVVGVAGLALLFWIGNQLVAVPALAVRLDDHERRLGVLEQLAQQQARLIVLLEADAKAREAAAAARNPEGRGRR